MTDKEMENKMSKEDQTLHKTKLDKSVEESADKKEETQLAEPEKKEEQPK
mgnify:CR=1 FL=1